jgi:hypothetical protein
MWDSPPGTVPYQFDLNTPEVVYIPGYHENGEVVILTTTSTGDDPVQRLALQDRRQRRLLRALLDIARDNLNAAEDAIDDRTDR